MASRIKRQMPSRIRDAVWPAYPAAARPWLQASFSQTGEDRIVSFIFGELGIAAPTYLDVGAYHPFHLSNTALLHLAGSSGINIEPDPDAIELFCQHRPDALNLNIGVGAAADRLTFYRMSASTLNTFSKDAAVQAVEASNGRHQIESEAQIEVRTVADILREHGERCPDFLSLDVEGMDLGIVRTMPEWPGLPTVVCVETITYSEHGTGLKVPEIGAELGRLGYVPFADTYINTVFVLRERWVGH